MLWSTMTTVHAPEMIHPPAPPQPGEHVEQIRRVSRLRADLAAATRDNKRFERALVLERAENRRLREQFRSSLPCRAREQRRRMLCAQCSRNP
jgi:hypothetical protein